MKKCSKCKKEKEITEFIINRKSPDGRGGYCADCRKQYRTEHSEKKKPLVRFF